MKKKWMIAALLLAAVLAGCGAEEPEPVPETTEPTEITEPVTEPETEPLPEPDPVEEALERMTVEEKIGQLFLARCPEKDAAADAKKYHLGGYILFGRDFADKLPENVRQKIAEYQASAEIPMLIAVDEEGGTVCRVSSQSAFRAEKFPSPRSLWKQGGMELVLSVESEKAYLLRSLGINVNMAPVVDVTTVPGAFMYDRSLGQSPEVTGEFAVEASRRMAEYGVGSVLKHFPGYGSNADTHTDMAVDNRSLETLENADLVPFAMGIEGGCGAILISHNVITALDGELPASLSPAVHEYLRETIGFDGVIITDELSMGAVAERYGAGEAAVMAVNAGNDILCTTDYRNQFRALLEAAEDGRISGQTLDSAVRRVLNWKKQLGML